MGQGGDRAGSTSGGVLADPNLRPAILASDKWPSSKSPMLRDAHTIITKMAKVIQGEVDRRKIGAPRTRTGKAFVASVKIGGRIDVVHLSTVAHHHPQRALTSYFYAARTVKHKAAFPWEKDARIASEGSKRKSATSLPNIYTISADVALDNNQAVFFTLHKLGIELPFLPPNARCSQHCTEGGPGYFRLHPHHELLSHMQHGRHQAQCSLHYVTTTRHDAVLRIIRRYLRIMLLLSAKMGFHLNRDVVTKKSTDILVGFPDRPGKRDLCIDYTCVCSFLPRYRSVASNDFEKHMGNVMKLKHDKHADYCMKAHNRDFHGLPATTLGRTGTSDFEEWVDTEWRVAVYKLRRAGLSERELQLAKNDMYAEMHAIVIRYTTDHIIQLSEDQ